MEIVNNRNNSFINDTLSEKAETSLAIEDLVNYVENKETNEVRELNNINNKR